MQDRYRGGGGGRQGGGGGGAGGNRYGGGGGRRRRGRGGHPRDIYPDVGLQEPEEHVPWAEDFEREPNPDAEPLHLAYDSVYTHEGDVREELLENWVEASNSGKRWRCWNCGRNTQRFTQLRLPTLRTVVSICDNCSTWTVWDAWRDLANPRIFNFRRTIEDSEPAREAGPSDSSVPAAVRSNGSGGAGLQPAAAASAAASVTPQAPQRPEAETSLAGQLPAASNTSVPLSQPVIVPEPALQPTSAAPEASVTEAEAAAAAAKPKRARSSSRASGASAEGQGGPAKPRAPRSRSTKTEQPPTSE